MPQETFSSSAIYAAPKHRREPKRMIFNGQELVILGEQILSQKGPYCFVRRYVKGKHPSLGKLQMGWSKDWETVWETVVIRPSNTFSVIESKNA